LDGPSIFRLTAMWDVLSWQLSNYPPNAQTTILTITYALEDPEQKSTTQTLVKSLGPDHLYVVAAIPVYEY